MLNVRNFFLHFSLQEEFLRTVIRRDSIKG